MVHRVGAAGARVRRYVNEHPIEAATTVPLKTMHCTELPYVMGWAGFEWRYNDTDEAGLRG